MAKSLVGKKINVDGLRISYLTNRSSHHQAPILFLHGWGMTVRAYDKALELLANKYGVIAPDLPGFGGSSSMAGPQTYGRYAQFILDFVAALKVERVHLVGHSFGGGICATVAALHPEVVKTVTLLDCTGIPLLSFADLVVSRVGEVALEVLSPRKSLANHGWMLTFMGNLMRHPRNVVRSFHVPTRQDIRPFFAQIKVPTLIAWGEQDRLIPFSHAIQFSRLVPNVDLVTVENGFHEWPMMQAQRAYDVIDQFYQKNIP